MELKIFDQTLSALERKMDLAFKRHKILTGNVANTDTPNFRARELDFAGELKKVLGSGSDPLAKTHDRHLDTSSNSGPFITFDNTGRMGPDGNNVDLDVTLGKISQNSRSYTGAINLLTMKLRLLRMAAMGRAM